MCEGCSRKCLSTSPRRRSWAGKTSRVSGLLQPAGGFLAFAYLPQYTLIVRLRGSQVYSVCIVYLTTLCVTQTKLI